MKKNLYKIEQGKKIDGVCVCQSCGMLMKS